MSKEKVKYANCKNISEFLIKFAALPELLEDIVSEKQENKINIV